MMNRLWIVLGLITATCCFASGYWLADRKPVKTVFQDRVVVQHSERHDDISTVTERKVTKPSGEVIATKTTKIEKSVEKVAQVEQKRSLETTSPQALSSPKNYRLSIYLPPRWPVTSYKDARIEVTHRLLGPVHAGVQIGLDGSVLVGLGIEF